MDMNKNKIRYGDIGQVIGLVVVGIGLGLELGVGGELYLIVITAGSIIFAVATKLKGR